MKRFMDLKTDSATATKIVRRTLASGEVKEYVYAKVSKKDALTAAAQAEAARNFHWVIAQYMASPEYTKLKPNTRYNYRLILDPLRDELGWMTLADLEDRRARTVFYTYRDSMADRPSAADHTIRTLSAVLGWAYRRGVIGVNHAREIEPLVPPGHSRAEITWSGDDIAAFIKNAKPEAAWAVRLALLTAGRMSDLCALRWTDINDDWLSWTPTKTEALGVQVHIPLLVMTPLKDLLDEIPNRSETILTNPSGHTYGRHSLGPVFRAERNRILPGKDLHFHDLRGTAITQMLDAGCNELEASAISGHVIGGLSAGRGIGNMRRYVKQTRERATNACTKWARYLNEAGTVEDLNAHRA